MNDAFGIYCIQNKVNGKRYIGSTAAMGFRRRWNVHRQALRMNKHHSPRLQSSWNKYGAESFDWMILQLCSPEECLREEQKWIDKFDSANSEHGYNINSKADSSLGTKRSEETKARIGAMKIGFKHSVETKDRMSKVKRGKVFSEEHKQRISDALRGRRQTQQHSVASATSRRGLKQKPEVVALRAAVQRGKKQTAEHSAKIAAALRGRKRKPFTEEAKANMAKAHRGLKQTAECISRRIETRRRNALAKLLNSTAEQTTSVVVSNKFHDEEGRPLLISARV